MASAKKTVMKAAAKIEKPETYEIPAAETPVEEKVVETPTATVKKVPTEKTYRFMTTLNNVNIGNAIHHNIQVVVYTCKAMTEADALLAFREHIAKNMKGNQAAYAQYFKAVFGKAVIIESYEPGAVERKAVPHGL